MTHLRNQKEKQPTENYLPSKNILQYMHYEGKIKMFSDKETTRICCLETYTENIKQLKF